MRLSIPARSRQAFWALLAALLFSTTVLAPAASAQDEFDEFDEEFEEEQREPARGSTDDLADEEDDTFGDADEADDSAPEDEDAFGDEDEDEPRATPGGRGRGGDLLKDSASDEWRDRRIVLHNTWYGSVGGIHVVDAGSGPAATFRAQLLTDFFFTNGFISNAATTIDGPTSETRHVGGSLSLSWTPWDFLELYGSIGSYANSNPDENPNLFQVLGDSRLGFKAFVEVLPFLTIGGDAHVALLNTVGDIGLVGDSTSAGFRANATLDLRGLEANIPLIGRLNLMYFLDNSAALVRDVEHARYLAIPDRAPTEADESRNLVTRIERFALGINRTDFFTIAVGFEVPITVMQDFTISPIAEWVLDIPANRQGYSCLESDPPGSGKIGGSDACLAQQNFSAFDAFPSTLTLGVRVMPPFRGLSITLAADIGTTGTNTFVRELAGNAPYDVILGAGYAFDTVPRVEEVEREVERRVEVPAVVPPKGRIVGAVVEAGAGTPITGAAVAYVGRDLTAQTTNGSGAFTSYELDPGEVVVDVTHPEYNAGRCSGTIPAEGGDVQVRCELQAMPRMGIVRGTVRSDTGSAISGASVNVTGPQSFTAITDASGVFNRPDLPPGNYTARVDAEGFLITQESFVVRARETATPELTAVARPTRSLITLRDREIIIRRQVNFATDSAEILPDSHALLSEIADTMIRHPELRRVEIQGHTDNAGDDSHNLELSQRRADSVRQWLTAAGVEAGRLTSQGYGEARPLRPNITAANRARNRRVQFMIEERAE